MSTESCEVDYEKLIKELKSIREREIALCKELEKVFSLSPNTKQIELYFFIAQRCHQHKIGVNILRKKARSEPFISIKHKIIYEALRAGFTSKVLSDYLKLDISTLTYIRRKQEHRLKNPLKRQQWNPNKYLLESADSSSQEKIQPRSSFVST